MDQPPLRRKFPFDPTKHKIDFSEFHDLFHPLWACKGYPGGKRRHLQYLWQFKWSSEVRRHTLCRVRRHQWTVWYRRDGDEMVSYRVACRHCVKRANAATETAELVRERQRLDRS